MVTSLIFLGKEHNIICVDKIDAVNLVVGATFDQIDPAQCVISVSLEENLIEDIGVEINYVLITIDRVFKLNRRVHQAEAKHLNRNLLAR